MDKFILEHINRLHQEGLSEEAVKSLNILESEIGVLSAELEELKRKLMQEGLSNRCLSAHIKTLENTLREKDSLEESLIEKLG